MSVSTRTLTIAFVALSTVGLGIFLMANRPAKAGPPGTMDEALTDVVHDFVDSAEAASWTVDKVSTQVFQDDRDPERSRQLTRTLSSFSGKGGFVSAEGKLERSGFETSMYGPINRWTGHLTFKEGRVPVDAELLRSGRDLKIASLHVITPTDTLVSEFIATFLKESEANGWRVGPVKRLVSGVNEDAKRLTRIQSLLDEMRLAPNVGKVELVKGRCLPKDVGQGSSLTWEGRVHFQYVYWHLRAEVVPEGKDWKLRELIPVTDRT